jgi:hypothetical protein
VGWLLISTPPIYAQESPAFEKIRDVSPDGKFAVRISCSSQPEDPDNIDPSLITAVELVSLPSKKIVEKLPRDWNGAAPRFIWSKDSNWLAFPLSSGPRFSDTYVYHVSGDHLVAMGGDEELGVNAKGDVRNQDVSPTRWLRPGVLLLEQFDVFRGGDRGADTYSAHYRFTATFDEKTAKFRISSKKKLPPKE